MPFFDQGKDEPKATRDALLARIVNTPALMLPSHFADTNAGHVRANGDGFTYEMDSPMSLSRGYDTQRVTKTNFDMAHLHKGESMPLIHSINVTFC